MKQFLIKILLFFGVISFIDVMFGVACQYLNSHSKGGGIQSRYYVCKESGEEVLVFGSSRAKHHYVPDIIEENLNMTCYNAGEDGNGIILCYGFLKMITQRYTPKLIIYDVSGFDIYEDDNMKYLDLIKPFYSEPGIDSVFWEVNGKTRMMMMSNLYRYNTTCLRLLGNYIHPMTNYPKGYYALNKTMDYEPDVVKASPNAVDTLKLQFFERFIQLVKKNGIELVCMVSPSYKPYERNLYYAPIERLCERNSIPFANYETDAEISFSKSFFQDQSHMNDTGAKLYSRKVCEFIRQEFR